MDYERENVRGDAVPRVLSGDRAFGGSTPALRWTSLLSQALVLSASPPHNATLFLIFDVASLYLAFAPSQ